MKLTKRILAFMLSAMLLLSAMPFCAQTALADDTVRTVDTVSHSDLDSKITAYETKLNGLTKPSYGMENAYNKYVYALAVQDAANYGSLNDSSAFSTASGDLDTATSGIVDWAAKKGTAVPKIGSTTIPSSYYNNVLYADGSGDSNFNNTYSFTVYTETAWSLFGLTEANATVKVYYPDTTIMYDGESNPKFPLIINMNEHQDNRNFWPQFFYPTNGGFTLSDYWWGQKMGFGWPTDSTYKIGNASGINLGHDSSKNNVLEISGTSNFFTFRNSMIYNSDPGDTLTTQNGFSWAQKYDRQFLTWGSYEVTNSTSQPIHIINYKKLIDKVDAKKTLWTSTAKDAKNGSYREGGFADFMKDLDNASYDPNFRFSSANNYQACADDIDRICSALDSPSARTADTHQTAYQALRDAENRNQNDKGTARSVYAAGNTKWTTDSWNAFKTAMEAAMDAFDAVVDTSAKTYSYTLSSAGTLATDLIAAYDALVERADYSEVDADAANATYNNITAIGNYTYDSYLAFVNAKNAVKAYSETATATKLNTRKADVQTALDDAHDALTAAYGGLKEHEADSVYETFEAIRNMINSSLTGKYNAAAIASVNEALAAQEANIYHIVTADEAALLGVPAGTKLKNTDGSSDAKKADTYSANLLTAFNNNDNSNNYVKYVVRFIVNKDGANVKDETNEAVFGTAQLFELGSYYDENAVILWETVTSEGGVQQSTNKSYGGESVAKLINSDVTVTATVTSRPSSSDYLYNIYNGNGRLVKSEYHDNASVTSFDDAVDLVTMPFYVFKRWYTKVDEGTKTVTVIADYEQLETVTVSALDGTITNLESSETLESPATVLYDQKAQVDYTGENFYAWAVKLGEKYTIVSYNARYEFYTHTSLAFVPVIKVGNAYQFKTENANVAVTSALIASAQENTYGKTADEFLAWKLNSKAPFVAVVGTKSITETNQRAYAIVTDGCFVDVTRLGVKFTKNGTDPINETNHALSNILPTGQFSVSLNNATAANARFRVTVNYNSEFSFGGTTSRFDTVDISDMAQVQ